MESDEKSGEDSDYDYEESDEVLPDDPPPSSEESSEEDEDDDKYKPYEEKNHTKQSTYYTVSSNIKMAKYLCKRKRVVKYRNLSSAM